VSTEPLPPAVEADLKAYVEWNTCTRHQLIVAHMTQSRAWKDMTQRLAVALGESDLMGLYQLVDVAIAKIEKSK
jgi:hypothetical protein